MTKIENFIIDLVKSSAEKISSGAFPEEVSGVYLEIPKEKKFGDFSTNIAMRLTKALRKPPYELAGTIVDEINKTGKEALLESGIEDIRIEKPGFINFYISHRVAIDTLSGIIEEGLKYGRLSLGKGKKIQVEFVSANPTGPLTVAHGRQAAVGDSLARILEFCGYEVVREYYLNDEGVQMGILGESVKSRYLESIGDKKDFPENGYKGGYIYDIAGEIRDLHKGSAAIEDNFFVEYAYKWLMKKIEKDLEDFGVAFDVWYSQKKLSKSGKIEKAFDILRKKGFLYEKDGATWFKSTEFGDDKDRVVIKNDGTLTYLSPDIAYHKEKFEKGYSRIINIWGPDHHGYIKRIKAACQALGFDKDALFILISQLVTLYRDKKPVRMSTREGDFITLRQVMDEVGKDAARFFFMMRRTDSHLDFDLELAKSKTMENPVFYIQYAHARISSIVKFSDGAKVDLKNLHLLDKDEERDIIKELMRFPKIIESSERNLEPHVLLSYLQDLAGLFHSYYNSHRIVTDDKILTAARLAMAGAVRTALYNGLTLLGVSAPEKM